jgi:hypothetical protein
MFGALQLSRLCAAVIEMQFSVIFGAIFDSENTVSIG